MERRLIVGYDGSENGGDALSLAVLLSECLAARPLVATVLPLPYEAHLVGSEQVEASIEQASESLLERARERFDDVEIETRTLHEGSPARALTGLAEEVDPIALVVGSAHRGAVGRVLLGSVGTTLLSGAPCAVAVAPRGYASETSRRLLRLAAAIDGSEESLTALHAAAGIAARLHGSLTVIAVVEPIRVSHGGQYPAIDPGTYHRASETELEKALDRALGELPEGLPAETRLLEGEPPAALAEAAGEFDLLAIGSRGYGPIRRALLGSVSVKLMQVAPCPVLVLPRGAGADPLGLAATGGSS